MSIFLNNTFALTWIFFFISVAQVPTFYVNYRNFQWRKALKQNEQLIQQGRYGEAIEGLEKIKQRFEKETKNGVR